ncbi:MAG: hypothetical protein C4306_06020 [Thermoleophilia bacterium]
MTTAALSLYAVLLAASVVATWRRPLLALFLFLVGLAVHNLAMALLYGAGVRGAALDAIQAWKEVLLAVAAARVGVDAIRARRLPFRPGLVDGLALAFAVVVVIYALVPQEALGGEAGATAVLYALRHALVPVVAYFLGRSLALGFRELTRIGWTALSVAGALSLGGLIELYTVPVEWWRGSGAVGYFRHELGFDYHGPGGLPDNFAFNTSEGLFRRLVSSFISPLATAFALVVALFLSGLPLRSRRLRPVALSLVGLSLVALFFTLSRSSLIALACGLVVLALAARRRWPLAAATAVIAVAIGFAYSFPAFAPKTHFFSQDLPYQEAQAREKGGLPGGRSLALDPGEPSLRSHWDALREGVEAVLRHPQGYGLGNAGATASRFGLPVRAGESNYTETGVETGLLGVLLLVSWNLALLAGLVRAARLPSQPSFPVVQGEGDLAGPGRDEGPDRRLAAALAAAALAAVLALAVQTDVYGVPWLAYTLWWVAGALLQPVARQAPDLVLAPASAASD